MSAELQLRGYHGEEDDTILAELASRATGELHSPYRIAYELGAPGIDPERDIAICSYAGDVVGYACLQIRDIDGVAQGRLTNRVIASANDASQKILQWAARRMEQVHVSSDRPITIIERVLERDSGRMEFLEDHGFRVVRYFHMMRLDHPASVEEQPTEGYRFVHGPGHDGAAQYVEMFNNTWIDHYGFTPLTVEEFIHDIESDPDYDTDLDIVLESPNHEYVGFAFCRIDPSDPQLGEVMAIGIRRGSRGIGLGRALLLHAIRTLVRKGAMRVELGVDSENPSGAESLYTSVGFRVVSVQRRYQLDSAGIARLAAAAGVS